MSSTRCARARTGEAGMITLVARYDDQHGILDVADLAELVPDLAERTTFACGPAGLLDALEQHHVELGLKLLTEQFRVTMLVAGEGGTVSFTQNDVTVEADGSRPILDEAEAAGVLMPVSYTHLRAHETDSYL